MTEDSKNYFRGGPSELVDSPTKLTFSFLSHWFKGTESFGKAMAILSLPHKEVNESILKLRKGNVVVDLNIEQEILYSNTLFIYKRQKSITDTPKLRISARRLLNPIKTKNTMKFLSTQTKWTLHPEKQIKLAESLIENIPKPKESLTLEEIDNILSDGVWSKVIAIGYLAEFYLQSAKKSSRKDTDKVVQYITRQSSQNDWFIKSIKDQYKVKEGTMSFSDYLDKYQFRAEDDYEVASPRWYEIRKETHDKIKKLPSTTPEKFEETPKTDELVNAAIKMQVLRSKARKELLPWIDLLRRNIINTLRTKDIGDFTRDEVLSGKVKKRTTRKPARAGGASSGKDKKLDEKSKGSSRISILKQGRGKIVSKGIAEGTAVIVNDTKQNIPEGSVCVFPSAGVKFSMLYPKCGAMLFLSGGQTSHGSIVAREYGIPAIVDQSAEFIEPGSMIAVDADAGTWKAVG